MAEAQRGRYAAANKTNGLAAEKPATKKRKLSAAGRKRIIEATKKRWAAYRRRRQNKSLGAGTESDGDSSDLNRRR